MVVRPNKRNNKPGYQFLVALLLTLACTTFGCCGGSGAGNNINSNGSSGDAGADATLDAQADAWTYECPESQPEKHVCLRGQIRRIVDDEPLAFPEGGLVQRIVPEPGVDYPTVLQAEAEVRPDGRFIFPSVQVNIYQDIPDDMCNPIDPDCHPYRYDYFDLVLVGEVGDASSFRIPRNRYGAVWAPNSGTPKIEEFIIGYYLVSEDTFNTWEKNWPEDPLWPFWCPLDPFGFDDVKIIIPVCYDTTTFDNPPDLLPSERATTFRAALDPAADDFTCHVFLPSDRLSCFNGLGDPDPYDRSGMGLFAFDWHGLTEPARISTKCSYQGTGPAIPVDIPERFMVFTLPEVDDSGPIVVTHQMASYRRLE